MWIVIQLIFSPVVFSLLSSYSQIWRGINKYNDGMEDLDFDHYTETELHKIGSFRLIIKDVLVKEYQRSDDFRIRWLREAHMDLKSANRSLRHALKWRQDNQIDTILNKTFPIKTLLRPCNVEGVDKIGGPIIIYKFKGIDLRNILASSSLQNSLSQLNQCFERYLQDSISGGPDSEQIRLTPGVGIFDLQGASLKQHGCLKCVDFYRQVVTIGIQIYPRTSRFIVIVNAPPFARRVVETLKPFLTSYAKRTLKVFGTEREERTEFLLTLIPKDQLPLEYGGTKQTLTS